MHLMPDDMAASSFPNSIVHFYLWLRALICMKFALLSLCFSCLCYLFVHAERVSERIVFLSVSK